MINISYLPVHSVEKLNFFRLAQHREQNHRKFQSKVKIKVSRAFLFFFYMCLVNKQASQQHIQKSPVSFFTFDGARLTSNLRAKLGQTVPEMNLICSFLSFQVTKTSFLKCHCEIFYTVCAIIQVAPLNTFLLDGVVTEYISDNSIGSTTQILLFHFSPHELKFVCGYAVVLLIKRHIHKSLHDRNIYPT